MIVYFDTSTLIKLIVDEAGSEHVAEIWDKADALCTVRLTYVEAAAALAAARRGNRLTDTQYRRAIIDLDDLWNSLTIVDVTAEIVTRAAHLAAVKALRGYDAVQLAAALETRVDLFSCADTRLCEAARTEGLHVANPLQTTPPADTNSLPTIPNVDADQLVQDPTEADPVVATVDSGLYGIPIPAGWLRDPERKGDFRIVDRAGNVHDLVRFYRDWMSEDGWIYDAEYSTPDPYTMEQQPQGGYFVTLIFVKPTTPPTTIAIILGPADGQPGHNKQRITISIGELPDDELPRRSVQLGPADKDRPLR